MVEDDDGAGPGQVAGPAAAGALTAADVTRWRLLLDRLDRDGTDADRIDQLRSLEELKAAACAAQARIAVDLSDSVRAQRTAAGCSVAERGRGIGAQIALARRESPARGGRLLGLATSLVREMPHTYRALREGQINEWRATLLVRESACLSLADHTRLAQLGDRGLVAHAKQVAYRLDAASVVARAARAERERCVTLRPAPDTMSYLTGLLPVAQGVSVLATLARDADARRAQGDPRTRNQLMADLLVERTTGQSSASQVPVELGLVMTDRTLLAADHEPAIIPGYGTVPGGWARKLIADRTRASGGGRGDFGADGTTLLWLRRLFTHPSTGQLVAMTSRRRTVPRGLARFIDTRDQSCRTPWCDAPVRHRDHIQPHARGGTTSADNLQGLCEACNYNKTARGWRAAAGPPGTDPVITTTPTGHRYVSVVPALPGAGTPGVLGAHGPPDQVAAVAGPPDQAASPLERHMARLLDAA